MKLIFAKQNWISCKNKLSRQYKILWENSWKNDKITKIKSCEYRFCVIGVFLTCYFSHRKKLQSLPDFQLYEAKYCIFHELWFLRYKAKIFWNFFNSSTLTKRYVWHNFSTISFGKAAACMSPIIHFSLRKYALCLSALSNTNNSIRISVPSFCGVIVWYQGRGEERGERKNPVRQGPITFNRVWRCIQGGKKERALAIQPSFITPQLLQSSRPQCCCGTVN